MATRREEVPWRNDVLLRPAAAAGQGRGPRGCGGTGGGRGSRRLVRNAERRGQGPGGRRRPVPGAGGIFQSWVGVAAAPGKCSADSSRCPPEPCPICPARPESSSSGPAPIPPSALRVAMLGSGPPAGTGARSSSLTTCVSGAGREAGGPQL